MELERVSRYPDALARLQTAALDGDDEYLDAVIKEAMRLRPAFPLTARLATEPFGLPGLTIPSGTMVVPYITLVHRRPELYPDPLTFRPERFLDTRAGTYTGILFGGGPRRCIGAAFSLTEARIGLRTILRHARLEPSTSEQSESRTATYSSYPHTADASHSNPAHPTPTTSQRSPTRPRRSRLTLNREPLQQFALSIVFGEHLLALSGTSLDIGATASVLGTGSLLRNRVLVSGSQLDRRE